MSFDAVHSKAPPFSNQLPVFFHLWHCLGIISALSTVLVRLALLQVCSGDL